MAQISDFSALEISYINNLLLSSFRVQLATEKDSVISNISHLYQTACDLCASESFVKDGNIHLNIQQHVQKELLTERHNENET